MLIMQVSKMRIIVLLCISIFMVSNAKPMGAAYHACEVAIGHAPEALVAVAGMMSYLNNSKSDNHISPLTEQVRYNSDTTIEDSSLIVRQTLNH